MDFQIKERIGTFEKLAITASVILFAAPFVASRIFSQTSINVCLNNHRYHLLAGSFVVFSASLLSAAFKKVEKPPHDEPTRAQGEEPAPSEKDYQNWQMVVWKPLGPRLDVTFYGTHLFQEGNRQPFQRVVWKPLVTTASPCLDVTLYGTHLVQEGNRQPFQLTPYAHCFLPELDVSSPVKMPNPLPNHPWFAASRLPQTPPPIQPGVSIPLPELVPAVMKSLKTPEEATKQIERDFKGSALFLDGSEYLGTTAQALIDRLKDQFNLTPELAYKAARLLTQACLPEVIVAVGQGVPFLNGFSDPMELTENSRRIVQDEKGFVYRVSRSQGSLQIVGQISFLIRENQQITDRLHVTLHLKPMTDEASYVIEHELCDKLTLSLLEEAPQSPPREEKCPQKVDLPQALAQYLQEHKNTIGVKEALAYARHGQTLYGQIMEGGEVKRSTDNDARDLLWHFVCAQILQEGGASEEWTWKIHDPKGYLTTFFQNMEGCENRISSHFKTTSLGSHKGFNLPNPDVSPARKGHALVVELDPRKYGNERFLGLKPENYGSNHPMHAFEFVVACLRKLTPGADEQGDWRKERIPSAFKSLGSPRICDLDLTKEGVQSLIKLYGYSEETISYRDGNEVILMKPALSSIPYPERVEPLIEPETDLGNSILGSWIFPEENRRLESYSHLIPAILKGCEDRESIIHQIHNELQSITLTVQGKSVPLDQPEVLSDFLAKTLNVEGSLAWKIAFLITSPSILSFFRPESDETLTVEIPQKPHFSIERIGKELTIKAKGSYICRHSEQGTQAITRTVDIDPIKKKMWSELVDETK